MKSELTKQDILDLLDRQAKEFHQKLLESEKSRKEFEESMQKSSARFDKMIGELGGTWGRFVAEMVRPRIVELFRERGIEVQGMAERVFGFLGGERYYEVDMLLRDSDVAVALEIKTTLRIEDVKEHLERLDKIKRVQPKIVNLSGVKLLGAVAGIIIENHADRYAYKNGLFVLRQKGNIIEIVNDDKFVPKEWKVEY